MSVLLLIHTWVSPSEKAAPRDTGLQKPLESPNSRGRVEDSKGAEGAQAGVMNRERRGQGRRRGATLQAAGRILDDLRRNQQGQGSGPVAQNCPSREGSALSAWEMLQRYTQRSSTIQTCFFKKSLLQLHAGNRL